MKKLLLIASLLLAFNTANAQSTSAGLVMNPVAIREGIVVFFSAVGSTTAGVRPACATWGFAADVKTPGGRAMYAMVLQAYALGKTLFIQGSGLCDLHSSAESVNWVYITN